MSDARERILRRVRRALAGRTDSARPHPGALDPAVQAPLWGPAPAVQASLPGAAPGPPASPEGLAPSAQGPQRGPDLLAAFTARLVANKGEVVRLADESEAGEWLAGFAAGFQAMAVGAGVPRGLTPDLPERRPEDAELGVSMAVGAAAQTGSVLLSSREGRRVQLLPPTHLVWVRREDVVGTLGDALARCAHDLPALLALHSGPSKSADIGQILVTGVHGPGRLVVAVVG